MLCHFAHYVPGGHRRELTFETVRIVKSDLAFDQNVRGYVTVDEFNGWTPSGDVVHLGRIAFPRGFNKPYVVGRRDNLVASACTSIEENIIHGCWLAWGKCGAVFLKSTFDHYWREVQDGAKDRGLILTSRVAQHVWDDYVDVECVLDSLLGVSYLTYRVNFDFFPTCIQFMAQKPDGEREYGWIKISRSARPRYENGDVVFEGLHQTSLGPTIEDIVLRMTHEDGDDHAFVVLHYRFDKFVKTAFVHNNDEAYNVYATVAMGSDEPYDFDDLARKVRHICNARRVVSRSAFQRLLKHELGENETETSAHSGAEDGGFEPDIL